MITDPEVFQNMKTHHLFSSLHDDQVKALLSSATRTPMSIRAVLFNQGDRADRFYFVHKGIVRLFRTSPNGHEKVVDIVRQGQCFAEAIMFSAGSTYPVSADAQDKSEVIGIENHAFMQLLKNDSSMCLKLLQQMSVRLHSQLNEIENLSLQNAMHRLINFLLHEVDADYQSIDLDIPKKTLASQLGIQPETFSRLLKELNGAGAIRVEKHRLTILQRDKLYRLIRDDEPL